MRNPPERWLHRLPQNAAANANAHLVCFPHAGGSAASFRDWGSVVHDMQVWVAKYPGRADRIHEPCATSILSLARSIAQVIPAAIAGPVALFGHSMGAVVAFEAARAMEPAGTTPLALFVSGSMDGQVAPPDSAGGSSGSDQTEVSDDELVAQLKAMGSIDDSLIDSVEFRELVLPYVRSDGQIFREYRLIETPTLRCPIVAIVGDIDTDANVFPWSDLTRTSFRQHIVPGGHFYLQHDPPGEIIRRICNGLLARSNDQRTKGFLQ